MMPDFAKIPRELQGCSQWVVYRIEQRETDGKPPKPTKVPYTFAGKAASSTDPKTWGTFEEATESVRAGLFDGIGFVITETNPYTVVDLDGVRDTKTGTLTVVAQSQVDGLDSYTEVSPSGRGVHVWTRARKPGPRCRTGNIEVYDDERFLCMTGAHLPETPETIEDRQSEIDVLYSVLFPAPARSAEWRPPQRVDVGDAELLITMFESQRGHKIERLWRGDTSGYVSASEADAALCAYLAFWTDRDANRMDSLFRQSGLYREKWESRRSDSTYGAQTIQSAIAITPEGYTPNGYTTSAKVVPINRNFTGADAGTPGLAHGEEPPPDTEPAANASPQCSKEHGVVTCTWGSPTFLTFEFDRFAVSRDELSAEVVVLSTIPGLTRELLRRRLPLLGTRAVPDFAKDIKGKLREQKITDLDGILEFAIQRAVQFYREGEPGRYIQDIPLPQGDQLILPFVVDGRNGSMLYGDPGEGKSTIAAFALATIHLGRDDLLGIPPTRQLRCAYFNWEDDGSELRSRYARIFGSSLPDILHVECRGALWDEADRLRRIIKEHRIEFAAFDSVGLACGGLPPDTSEAALRFSTAFKSLEIGGLLIAHKAKAEQEDSPFGSMFWRASARNVWRVRKHQEISATSYVVGLYSNKTNNGAKLPPLSFQISYEHGHLTAARTDIRDDEELSQHLSVKTRLKHALGRNGPMTSAAVAEETGIAPETVRRTLNRGEGEDFVRQTDAARAVRWSLARRTA